MNLNSKILTVLLFLFLSFFITIQTHAQDGHYWSENYGNRSMLLSGTVNASVEDLGAVFYNPGRLGLIENPAFVISAKVYEWKTTRMEDGIDKGKDLNKSHFGGAPSLVAGTFTVPFLKNHKFAYSFLTRQSADVDFFIRVEEEDKEFVNIPGKVLFNGKLNFNTKLKEEWIGLTWAPPIGEKFSFGLSNFITTLNKSSAIDLEMNTLDEQNQVASLDISRQYGYENYGLLWKMGIAWNLSPIHFGMTITTPKVNLHGKGSSLYEEYLIGVDTTGDGIHDDIYLFNIQDDLKARLRTPWAIGVGFGIPFKKGIIHLSAEWYGNVPRYTIFETEPFNVQTSGDTLSFSLVDDLNSVINYGIGFEMKLSEKISLYSSIATDYSAVRSDITRFAELEEEAGNSVFRMDFFKFGGGFVLNSKWAEITLGATYAGASQQIERPINFSGDDPVFDSGNPSTIKFTQWRFILGFSFPFADKLKDKVDGESEE